jgi:hypothetical protein
VSRSISLVSAMILATLSKVVDTRFPRLPWGASDWDWAL